MCYNNFVLYGPSYTVACSLEISAKEMNVGADRLAAILSKHAQEGRELNIWRQFGHMTMDVVGSAAFGWDPA